MLAWLKVTASARFIPLLTCITKWEQEMAMVSFGVTPVQNPLTGSFPLKYIQVGQFSYLQQE